MLLHDAQTFKTRWQWCWNEIGSLEQRDSNEPRCDFNGEKCNTCNLGLGSSYKSLGGVFCGSPFRRTSCATKYKWKPLLNPRKQSFTHSFKFPRIPCLFFFRLSKSARTFAFWIEISLHVESRCFAKGAGLTTYDLVVDLENMAPLGWSFPQVKNVKTHWTSLKVFSHLSYKP